MAAIAKQGLNKYDEQGNLTEIGTMVNNGKHTEAEFEDFSEGLPMKSTRNGPKLPKTAIS